MSIDQELLEFSERVKKLEVELASVREKLAFEQDKSAKLIVIAESLEKEAREAFAGWRNTLDAHIKLLTGCTCPSGNISFAPSDSYSMYGPCTDGKHHRIECPVAQKALNARRKL